MKERLNELADALNAAVATDTPRATMNAVANQLRALGADVQPDDAFRSKALDLAEMIDNHQYGLRGFGDGSMSRGRDLTQHERTVITKALRLCGRTKLPLPRYHHVPGDGQLFVTSMLFGVPANMEGLYTLEQLQELL